MDEAQPVAGVGLVFTGLLALFYGTVATGLGLLILVMCLPAGGLQCASTAAGPVGTFLLFSGPPMAGVGVLLIHRGKRIVPASDDVAPPGAEGLPLPEDE